MRRGVKADRACHFIKPHSTTESKMELLSLISQILQYFTDLFPRPIVIQENERGVYWRFGKEPRILVGGIKIVWPLLCPYDIFPFYEESIPFSNQRLTLADGTPVVVGGYLSYKIQDHVLLVKQCGAEYLDIFQRLLAECVIETLHECTKNKDQFNRVNHKQLNTIFRRKCQEEFTKYGTEVVSANFSDKLTANFILGTWSADA